jgi:signal transduction histidine kinase
MEISLPGVMLGAWTKSDNGAVSRARDWSARSAAKGRVLIVAPRADAVLASSLALVGLTEVIARAAIGGLGGESALAVGLLALGSTLPLALLGKAGAAAAICASSVLSLAGFHALTAAGFVALLIALYRLGHGSQQHVLVQLSALGLAVPFVVLTFTGPPPTSSEAAALTALLAALAPVAALGGFAQQARREVRDNRAARQVIADTLIEHTARGERARIAHELHDVVAHHISMVAVQAESARLAVPGMPPAGAQRLSAIGDTARAALVEMRRLLGVLRQDALIDAADRHPQPGLDQLNELIDEARGVSGSGTRLILRGAPIPLGPSVELAGYRIVQEALTNARRYAPGAAVDVEMTYNDDRLRLRIRDNGPGPDPSAPAGGHGVAGMHERAAAVGGNLHTGPAPGGGYLIDATLPAKIEAPA